MTTPTLDDYPRNTREARDWIKQYHRLRNLSRTQDCQHGHFDCSTRDGGPCMDEILHQWPEAAE